MKGFYAFHSSGFSSSLLEVLPWVCEPLFSCIIFIVYIIVASDTRLCENDSIADAIKVGGTQTAMLNAVCPRPTLNSMFLTFRTYP